MLMATVLVAPAATAGHTPTCGDGGGLDELTWPVYVRASLANVQVWLEDNGVHGLQSSPCTTADGDHVGPDVRLAKVPIPWCIPPDNPLICIN